MALQDREKRTGACSKIPGLENLREDLRKIITIPWNKFG